MKCIYFYDIVCTIEKAEEICEQALAFRSHREAIIDRGYISPPPPDKVSGVFIFILNLCIKIHNEFKYWPKWKSFCTDENKKFD